MNSWLSLRRLYPKDDGFSVIVRIFAAQSLALLGIIPGFLLIRFNAELNNRQVETLTVLTPLLVLFSFLLLLYLSWRITATARQRLDEKAKGINISNLDLETKAWSEITSLTWRYGILAVTAVFTFNVIPAYLLSLGQADLGASLLSPLSMESAPSAFVLLGGTASMLGSVIFAVFLIGRFTLPARLLLIPSDFDAQLLGRAGALVTGKFQILTIIIVAITILLIAPIGFQSAIQVIESNATSMALMTELQIRSILFSLLALLLGIGYSYYASKSISEPVQEMIQIFDRIEKGDLSARAPISATDELGIVGMQFNRMVTRLEQLQDRLEDQVSERTRQLSSSNELGRVASTSLDPDTLFVNVVNLFVNKFGYYFAAVYLIDSSEKWAELKEATGEAGKLMKQNHQRLEITGKSLVGSSIRDKTSQVSGIDSVTHRRDDNPLLPYTKSTIAVPLTAGDRILGALEIHSTKADEFTPEVVDTMGNMAGQVAIALENARLYQEAQHNIRELRAIQQQYLLAGWTGYTGSNEELEYAVGDESDSTPNRMEVPLNLRDQILGEIKLEGLTDWTTEQKSLVDAVAAQAAIAVENARLVSETRQAALRERMLAEINSRVWSSATIDAVLQTVVKELGRRLDASRVTIELNVDNPGNNGN